MSDSGTSIAAIGLTLAALATGPLGLAVAQPPAIQPGEVVPHDVRQIYDRGLQFLAASQSQDGTWDGGEPGPAMTQGLENAARADGSWASRGKQGPGVTALALLAFLASGEDANFGIYSSHIRKALRSLIGTQNANTGYIGPSMYHHGFAMLALAEAYGAVDERTLWPDEKAPRSVGQALELAVRAAITAQKSNSNNAWRYSPGGRDADASVTRGGNHRPARGPQRRDRGARRVDRQGNRLFPVDDGQVRRRLLPEPGQYVVHLDGPGLDRHARLRRGPSQGSPGIQGDSRLPQAADRRALGTFRGIHPLLRGAGPFPGGLGLLGEVEQDPRPPAQGGAAARRQHPGPVQPGDLHVAVAALAGAELSLPSHLRTMRSLLTSFCVIPVISSAPGRLS